MEERILDALQQPENTVLVFQSDDISVCRVDQGSRVSHGTGGANELHQRGLPREGAILVLGKLTLTGKSESSLRAVRTEYVVLFNGRVGGALWNLLPEL